MRRRLWIVPATVVVLLVVAHTVYWFWAQQQLERGFAAWLQARRGEGWTVTTSAAPTTGGWPLAATLTAPDLTLQGGDKDVPGGLRWQAERLELRLALLRPTVLEISPAGAQRARVGSGPEISYSAARLTVSVPLLPGGTSRVGDLDARGMRIDLPNGRGGTSPLAIETQHLHVVAMPHAAANQSALALALQVDAIDLPPGTVWPLGPQIASVRFDAALSGPLPQVTGTKVQLAAWHDAGGKLQVGHMALNWGPLAVQGTAALALDDQLQPAGNADFQLIGYAAAADALASNRVITEQAAMAAKAVLSLLARQSADGGPSEVDVPLRLQNRVLSMRQMQLVKVPPVLWPQD